MTRKILESFVLLAMVLGLAVAAMAQNYPTISYRDAEDHLDEIVWVEGTVLRTEKAPEGVYLLFSANEKYLRVIIPTANVSAFEGSIQHTYTGKKIKAVGKVTKLGYDLILGVNEPKRIRILDDET